MTGGHSTQGVILPSDNVTKLTHLNTRRWDPYRSKEELHNMVVLSRFMYSLQPDCAAYVRSQVPKTAREAARLAFKN